MAGCVRRLKFVFVPAAIFGVVLYISLSISSISPPFIPLEKHVDAFAGQAVNSPPSPSLESERPTTHPVQRLIQDAEAQFSSLLSKETHDLASTTRAYREARGRHPPPGFETWYEVAKAHDVVMVEDFWDQIYHDLRPFWALAPNRLRADARANNMVVHIKSGEARTDVKWFWHEIWADMISKVAQYLPDMVIPCNPMDEPRLLVPWETINGYVEKEQDSRQLLAPEKMSDVYRNWATDDEENSFKATELQWKGSASISLVRQACHPGSHLRNVNDISETSWDGVMPEHFLEGFVANYTLSTHLCHQPDIGVYHGAVIQPLTSSWTQQLVPLFGGSKLAVNNEILLPPPMPWTDEPNFSVSGSADADWDEKRSKVIWRGTATGGRHHPTNWHQFHRHRFAYLTNGTQVGLADQANDKILTPGFMRAARSALHPSTGDHLSEYLSNTTDVAFKDLFCDEEDGSKSCWYLDNEFAVVPELALSDQFNYKFLPDIDGNSFSGRYRAFLLSSSLPIKATIYREWHDARLVAWKHFVPMDNRFVDYYGILEYFHGFTDSNGSQEVVGHDEAARKIANDGRNWAMKVLRKEDMWIYVFRLLLEYARVCDDNRETLGYVEDLRQDA